MSEPKVWQSVYLVARPAQLLLSKIRSTFLFAGGDELPGQRDGHVRVARAGVPERALRRLLPEQHVVLLQVPALPGTLPEGMRQVLVVVRSLCTFVIKTKTLHQHQASAQLYSVVFSYCYHGVFIIRPFMPPDRLNKIIHS